MEYVGKGLRQAGMDTVQSQHTFSDISNIRQVLSSSELLVRCNPIHEATEKYCSSKEEIDQIVQNGADIIMLPYFKTVEEVADFINFVDGRAKTMLLFETPDSIEKIDEILSLAGIDEVFIGLNDLHLGYKKKFMFELLSDGTVERICNVFKHYGYTYGFGGLASLNLGLLPGHMVLKEHYRLGSSSVILSRSFCNTEKITDIDEVRKIFENGVSEIRLLEAECLTYSKDSFEKNKGEVAKIVAEIVN